MVAVPPLFTELEELEELPPEVVELELLLELLHAARVRAPKPTTATAVINRLLRLIDAPIRLGRRGGVVHPRGGWSETVTQMSRGARNSPSVERTKHGVPCTT
jgi:hypothetical protein